MYFLENLNTVKPF